MRISTFDCIAAITQHGAGFAETARRADLSAPVEHCPGWSAADLVWHLTEVHWFWATIVSELLSAPPEAERRPARPADADLVDGFVAGATRLVQALREADQSASCWTWAGWQQDVAFVTRHQVQEAAVHHWDLVHAVGGDLVIDADVATDAVDEFLHFSVAAEDDPDDPVTAPLDGTLGLRTTDSGAAWTLTDGSRPGTVHVTPGLTEQDPFVDAPAADLLLWLYGRADLDTSALPADLVGRFRGVCLTD